MTVLEIDEVSSLFSVKLQLTLTWKDQRLKYKDLWRDDTINVLANDAKAKIWIPKLQFSNSKDITKANFDDDASMGSLEIEDKALAGINHSAIHELNNERIYHGNEV